jgi:hypothetical protein
LSFDPAGAGVRAALKFRKIADNAALDLAFVALPSGGLGLVCASFKKVGSPKAALFRGFKNI